MIDVYLYSAKNNVDYDVNTFPKSLVDYLKNNHKEEISYVAYFLLMKTLKEHFLINSFDFDFTSKPRLLNERIFFNISHKGDYIAIGISYIDEIGVDLESTDREISSSLYERALSENEKNIRCEIYDKKTHFLMCFVRKEAYLKMKGTGFNIHPKNICVYDLDYYPVYFFDDEKLILAIASKNEQKINIFNFMSKK